MHHENSKVSRPPPEVSQSQTYGVKVGKVPRRRGLIVVQSMTNTDTADVETTSAKPWN